MLTAPPTSPGDQLEVLHALVTAIFATCFSMPAQLRASRRRSSTRPDLDVGFGCSAAGGGCRGPDATADQCLLNDVGQSQQHRDHQRVRFPVDRDAGG